MPKPSRVRSHHGRSGRSLGDRSSRSIGNHCGSVGRRRRLAVGAGINPGGRCRGRHCCPRESASGQQKNQAAELAADRAVRRAHRIDTSVNSYGASGDCDASIENGGTDDIYEVAWFPPLLTIFRDGKLESAQWGQDLFISTQELRDTRFKLENWPPKVLRPRERLRLYFSRTRLTKTQEGVRSRSLLLVTFVDADGYRIGRVYRRTDEDTRSGRHDRVFAAWDIVDDDYPNSVGGVLGECIAAVTGDMPASGPR